MFKSLMVLGACALGVCAHLLDLALPDGLDLGLPRGTAFSHRGLFTLAEYGPDHAILNVKRARWP